MSVVTQSRAAAAVKCELHISSPPDPGLAWAGLAWAGLGLVTPSCRLNLNTVYIHCTHSGPFMAATLVQSRQLIAAFRGQRSVPYSVASVL